MGSEKAAKEVQKEWVVELENVVEVGIEEDVRLKWRV